MSSPTISPRLSLAFALRSRAHNRLALAFAAMRSHHITESDKARLLTLANRAFRTDRTVERICKEIRTQTEREDIARLLS